MKQIIFYISIVASLNSYSQTVANPELNKFIGTWQWTSRSDTLIVVLDKQAASIPYTGSSNEVLVGWHKYVKNGNLIQNSLQYVGRNVNLDFDSTNTDLKITLEGTTRSANKMWFYSFWDLTLHKSCNVYLALLAGSTTQATWKLTDPQGIYAGPPGTYNQFTLPTNLLLTKQ